MLNDDRRENLIGRTLRPNEELLRVGNLKGDWHVELKIPQRNIGQILRAFADPRLHKIEPPRAGTAAKYLDVDVLLSQPAGHELPRPAVQGRHRRRGRAEQERARRERAGRHRLREAEHRRSIPHEQLGARANSSSPAWRSAPASAAATTPSATPCSTASGSGSTRRWSSSSRRSGSGDRSQQETSWSCCLLTPASCLLPSSPADRPAECVSDPGGTRTITLFTSLRRTRHARSLRPAVLRSVALAVALIGCNRLNSGSPGQRRTRPARTRPRPARRTTKPRRGSAAVHARRTPGTRRRPARGRRADRHPELHVQYEDRQQVSAEVDGKIELIGSRLSTARGWPLRVEAARRGAHRSTTRPSRTPASCSTRASDRQGQPEKWVPYWKLPTSDFVAADQVLCMLDDQMITIKPEDGRRRSVRRRARCTNARRGRRGLRRGEDRASTRTEQNVIPRVAAPRRPDHPHPVPREPGPGHPDDRQGRRSTKRPTADRQAPDPQPRERDHPQRRQAARRVRPGRREDLRDPVDREGPARRKARRASTPHRVSRNMVVTVEPAVPSAPVDSLWAPSARSSAAWR